MRHVHRLMLTASMIASACAGTVLAQSSTGSVSGIVVDQHGAVITGATVTIKSIETGFNFTAVTGTDGRYRFVNVPIGTYELTAEAVNFKKFERGGITLNVSQDAQVDVSLEAGLIYEVVRVEKDAPILNSTSAEVSTRFDSRRLAELPIVPNRSLYGVLLSAPGVNPLAVGQTAFAVGISLSANGGRLRSNSFLLDGQDINDPSLTGGQMLLNNPDAFQEVRIITNQFLPEFGRHSGSVVNFVGKSGTNDVHGSLFWFHNNESLNACSNTDKQAGFCNPYESGIEKKAPPREENQFGFTVGGPVIFPRFGGDGPYFYRGKDRTFFFTDYQRWSDRRSPSFTLRGAPTAAGRDALKPYAASRPQLHALLRFVPAAMPNPNLLPITVTIVDGPTFSVERGDLTATSAFRLDNDQGSFRIDHRFDEDNLVYGRYRYSIDSTRGAGQIAPHGFQTMDDRNTQAALVVWTSSISPAISNEVLVAWRRHDLVRDAENPSSKTIPAIQINDLGMLGDREHEGRTALGLATNVPIIRTNNARQISDAISVITTKHLFKFGADVRRMDEKDLFHLADRGSLVYTTLSNFVNDIAQSGSKALPLPGGDNGQFFRWNEVYLYAQDQFKILPTLTLTYGVRYEYPGDSFRFLRTVNRRVLAANGNDPLFRFEPYPKTDTNNWMPRIGVVWNPRTNHKGILGSITGSGKLVIRAGYARAYDTTFINTNQNIFGSFPFRATQSFAGVGAFSNLVTTTSPDLTDVWRFSRMTVSADFRSPAADQFSVDLQRELNSDLVFRIGYVRTRGTGLIQTIDGNPRIPCLFGTGPGTCNTTGIDRNTGIPLPSSDPILAGRIDQNRDIVVVRANSASSTYDGLQASLEKRLSRGLGFGLHYTWSALIDTASDVINLSVAEVAIAQDPFDRKAEKARSGLDRPHRLAGNIVYELPFFSKQEGVIGTLLGGWQVNSFFNFQSGAPFTALNGSDPAGVGSIGIRPNVYTSLNLSGMSVADLFLINQRLRTAAIAQAQQIFNGLTGDCVPGWLPGPTLPVTLFSTPRGRIVCSGGQRRLVLDFNGVSEGQRVGNAGRNILRADSFKNVDIGIIKNTQVTETVRAQFWVDLFNAFNWRNFGIPSGVVSNPGFLNQWATDGGGRRIRLGTRLAF